MWADWDQPGVTKPVTGTAGELGEERGSRLGGEARAESLVYGCTSDTYRLFLLLKALPSHCGTSGSHRKMLRVNHRRAGARRWWGEGLWATQTGTEATIQQV